VTKRYPTLASLSVILTLANVACGGATGPEGPPGPPTDRTKLYCRSHSEALNSLSSPSVSVRCDAVTDIPWQGACEASELPTGLYLSVNAPLDWEDLGAQPGWTCAWAAYGVVPNATFGGTARICCYPVGSTP
jgi:hypothetical protein